MTRTGEQPPSSGRPDIADRVLGYDQASRERPRPGSREDLQHRLDRLPHGHPSSPFNADGTRRPPPPRLRDYELPPSGRNPPPDPAPHLKSVPPPGNPAADANHPE